MMHYFYQPSFTAVIIYNAIAYMPYRANRKNNFQAGIELKQLVQTIIKQRSSFVDRHQVFIEPGCRCTVVVGNRTAYSAPPERNGYLFGKPVRKRSTECYNKPV